ncbi:MAG: glycosyltransferase family 4 protein [Cyclobacteriaceae bacterium]|nr:glycosyltransferase family 4 protein [Cyclobacteriaceae bacterium]
MKKILYIHQYFKTPEEGGALRSYHIACEMVRRGMQVEMITAYNGSKFRKAVVEGMVVYYLPVAYANDFSTWKRYFSFLKFAFAATKLASKVPDIKMVYASSTPLTVGLVAIWLRWKRKIPYVFEVRDLWPEAPIQLGFIRSPFLKDISTKLEIAIYKNAKHIVALSPGMASGVRKKFPTAKITVVPNMADVAFFDFKTQKNKEAGHLRLGILGLLACQTTWILYWKWLRHAYLQGQRSGF